MARTLHHSFGSWLPVSEGPESPWLSFVQFKIWYVLNSVKLVQIFSDDSPWSVQTRASASTDVIYALPVYSFSTWIIKARKKVNYGWNMKDKQSGYNILCCYYFSKLKQTLLEFKLNKYKKRCALCWQFNIFFNAFHFLSLLETYLKQYEVVCLWSEGMKKCNEPSLFWGWKWKA